MLHLCGLSLQELFTKLMKTLFFDMTVFPMQMMCLIVTLLNEKMFAIFFLSTQ